MADEIFVRLDPKVVAWLRNEGKKRERSLAWMVNEAGRQWKCRLERQRSRYRKT